MGRGATDNTETGHGDSRRLREVNVWGSVPVGITVDLWTGQITRVTVIDEALLLPNVESPQLSVEGGGELAVSSIAYSDEGITEEIARRAIEVVISDDADWPAWNIGW